MKKNILLIALALSTTFVSAFASAQSANESYFGAALGRTKWNFDCSGAEHCSTASASFKIFGGYSFSENLAIEGSYIYVNETDASDSDLKVAQNARGVDIAAVFKTPAKNNFLGFAKVGAAFMKGEAVAASGNFSASATQYSTQPLLGFGVLYQLDKKMSLRAEIDSRRVKVTGFAGTTSRVMNYSFGFQSEF